MSTGFLIALLIVVILIVGFLAVRLLAGKGTEVLRRRFGPEYDRTVARHDGDTNAAKKDLDGRLHRHGDLSLHPLTAEAYDQYAAEWSYAQEEFVEDPAKAAAHADGILSGVVRERGFPADPYREQLAALSVHHPQHLESYRRLHAAVHHTDKGRNRTEDLRELFVEARAFFDDLVGERPGNVSTQHTDEPERRSWTPLRRRDTSPGSTP